MNAFKLITPEQFSLLTEVNPTFCLPDGSVLKIKLPRDCGKQTSWWRKNLNFPKKVVNKQFAPIVGLWSSGSNFHVIAADFDLQSMPASFTLEKVRSILEVNCPGAIVCRSFSGNGMKAFFVVRLTNVAKSDNVMNLTTATEFLQRNLPKTLHWFDRAASALSTTFVNGEMTAMLSELLPDAPVYNVTLIKCNNPSYSHIAFNGSIPSSLNSFLIPTKVTAKQSSEAKRNEQQAKQGLEGISIGIVQAVLFNRKNKKSYDHKLLFLRIVLGCWGLLDGYELPQKLLAAQCGVSQQTVSTWLKELLALGFLSKADDSYIVGIKAKTYKAEGELAAAIKRNIEVVKQTPRASFLAPKVGTYYKFILRRLGAHSTLESLLTELQGFLPPNSHYKNAKRKQMAKDCWKSHQRKKGIAA